MKKILYIITIILVFSASINWSYAFSWEEIESEKSLSGELNNASETTTSSWSETKTIREIKQWIDELKNQTDVLEKQWDEFIKKNWNLAKFIQKNLSIEWKQEFQEIIASFESKQKQLEKDINNSKKEETKRRLKRELLSEKKELYKSLVPYIERSELREYFNYVRSSVEMFEKSKIVKDEIHEEEKKLEDKVSSIEEKIEEHNKKLSERIREIAEERLNSKIKTILENEKFNELSLEGKKRVFDSMLDKIESKKEKLVNMQNKASIVKKKIEIYDIAYEIVENAIKELK